VRCLLIYPNPESALNEEAGRLLLEKYEDYFKHAKLMTRIHAKDAHRIHENSDLNTEPTASLLLEKKVADRKRNLRRL
jgi:ubiquitin-conjugating enzyme E2 S